MADVIDPAAISIGGSSAEPKNADDGRRRRFRTRGVGEGAGRAFARFAETANFANAHTRTKSVESGVIVKRNAN